MLLAFSAWTLGSGAAEREPSETIGWRIAGVLLTGVLAATALAFAPDAADGAAERFASAATLGRMLAGDALLVLESLGVLLLVAIVGVTLLTVPGPRP